MPYWSGAIGKIPFAVGTYRIFKNIGSTVSTGMRWATGKPIDVIFLRSDKSNEYDNFFVLRGALYASKKCTYQKKITEGMYPVVYEVESGHPVASETLGQIINATDLKKNMEPGIRNNMMRLLISLLA